MVDPHPLLTFHNGAVCHLEHLWPHCSVCREGTWGAFSVEFEIRCSGGQTLPLPCSRYGVAWIMQSGFSPQLFFFLVAWDTLWYRIFENLNYILEFSFNQLFQVAASLCMLAGACLRCLPLLIPSMESSFTALCHAGLGVSLWNSLLDIFLLETIKQEEVRDNLSPHQALS